MKNGRTANPMILHAAIFYGVEKYKKKKKNVLFLKVRKTTFVSRLGYACMVSFNGMQNDSLRMIL